jgi:hypothetical protein
MRFDLSDEGWALLHLLPKSRRSARVDDRQDYKRNRLCAANRNAVSAGTVWPLHDGL